MNQLVHLRLSILELSKILKYKFCYDYIKPKSKGWAISTIENLVKCL